MMCRLWHQTFAGQCGLARVTANGPPRPDGAHPCGFVPAGQPGLIAWRTADFCLAAEGGTVPASDSTASTVPPFNWSEPSRMANPIPPQHARTYQGGPPFGLKAPNASPASLPSASQRPRSANAAPEPRPPQQLKPPPKATKRQPLNPYNPY